MKQLFTALVLLPVFSFAQNVQDSIMVPPPANTVQINPTTVAEYNYVTLGYIDVINKGLDPKRGYYISDMVNGQTFRGVMHTHRVDVQGLIDEKTKKLKATILLAYQDENLYRIFCLPNAGSDISLINKYTELINTLTDFQKGVFINSLSQAYAKAIYYANIK